MFEKLLLELHEALAKAGLGYMVIGGQAVLRYGLPRLTQDIDITLKAGPDQLAVLLAALGNVPVEVLVPDVAAFVEKTLVLPVRHTSTGVRVDFIFSYSPYEREAIDHAVELPVGGGVVRFARVEDLIIHKVFAGRARDLEDVRQILKLRTEVYDRTYVLDRLRELSLVLDADLAARFERLER